MVKCMLLAVTFIIRRMSFAASFRQSVFEVVLHPVKSAGLFFTMLCLAFLLEYLGDAEKKLKGEPGEGM